MTKRRTSNSRGVNLSILPRAVRLSARFCRISLARASDRSTASINSVSSKGFVRRHTFYPSPPFSGVTSSSQTNL